MEVGLVSSARLVQHHVLPEGVRKKHSVASRAAIHRFPSRQSLLGGSLSSTRVPVQLRGGVAQFLKASSRVLLRCQLVDHGGCDLWEPLVYHVQRVHL